MIEPVRRGKKKIKCYVGCLSQREHKVKRLRAGKEGS